MVALAVDDEYVEPLTSDAPLLGWTRLQLTQLVLSLLTWNDTVAEKVPVTCTDTHRYPDTSALTRSVLFAPAEPESSL
jgi:hypothetical protein